MIVKSKRKGNLIAMKRNYSRRDFIVRSAISGVGLGFAFKTTPSLASNEIKFSEETEPIIDIHQHTQYSGRTDDQLLTHQRAINCLHL